MRGSVRIRVTAIAVVVVAAVLGITALALVAIQRHELEASLDADVARELDQVEAALVSSAPDVVADRFAGAADESRALQLLSPTGVVVSSSPNLAEESPIIAVPGQLAPPGRVTLETVSVPSVDDDSFRAAGRRVATSDGVLVAVVALSEDEVLENTQTLTAALLVVFPLVLVLLGTVVWRLVGRTLRPVEAIRFEVSSIDSSDLDRRVPEPESDDEIARLAVTMNSMLERLERSTERQRRFVGDASHELRGPLTRMRTALEVDQAHPDRADPQRTGYEMLEEVITLERLVDDLLHLARSDDDAAVTAAVSVDLDDIVLEEARRLTRDSVQVDLSGVSAAGVVGDPAQLRRAVRNLLDNAVRNAESIVTVTLGESDDGRLLIEDDGPGIPADQRESVFERFTRLDAARSRQQGGTGLGLAISREIVERHGGTISVGDSPTGGASFEVRLPLPPDPASSDRP